MSYNPSNFVGKKYDFCWDFVVDLYAQSGIHLQRDAYQNSELFIKVDDPVDGALVILGQYSLGAHCGIAFDKHIYHHIQSLGVVRSRPEQFPLRSYHVCRT